MKAAAYVLTDSSRLGAAVQLLRIGQKPFEHGGSLRRLPGILAGWSDTRDLPALPKQTFRQWWAARKKGSPA